MAKAIPNVLVGSPDQFAVRCAYGLGDDDDAVANASVDCLDFGKELVRIQSPLGRVEEMRRIELVALAKGAGRGNPAGVASHDFNDLDRIHIVHGFGIAANRLESGRDEAGDRSVTGAVISDGQVIVDRLGNDDDSEWLANLSGALGETMSGIRGIVTADIGEVADLEIPKTREQAIGIAFLQLVAARAERGRRSPVKCPQRRWLFLTKVDYLTGKQPRDAVDTAEHARDPGLIERGVDHAE